MSRRKTPMTPERFENRDIKRRVTKLEKQNEYRRSDSGALAKRIRWLEDWIHLHDELQKKMEQFHLQALDQTGDQQE